MVATVDHVGDNAGCDRGGGGAIVRRLGRDRAQGGDDLGGPVVDFLNALASEDGGGGFQELVGEVWHAAGLEDRLHVEQDFRHRVGKHFAGGVFLAVAIGVAGGQDVGFGHGQRDIVDDRIESAPLQWRRRLRLHRRQRPGR